MEGEEGAHGILQDPNAMGIGEGMVVDAAEVRQSAQGALIVEESRKATTPGSFTVTPNDNKGEDSRQLHSNSQGPGEAIPSKTPCHPAALGNSLSVQGQGGAHGMQPNLSVTPLKNEMASDDADTHNSMYKPILDEECLKGTTAGSSTVTPKDQEDVAGETKTEKEEAHASIRSHWDVEEVEVLLNYYMEHAEQHLQKPGVPLVVMDGF
jgi:hypothetical protein